MTLTLEYAPRQPICDGCGEPLFGDSYILGRAGKRYCSYGCKILSQGKERKQ